MINPPRQAKRRGGGAWVSTALSRVRIDRRAVLTGLTALPLATAARAQESGTLVEHAGMTSRHVQPRDVTVWLPPGYDGGMDRHPVLYMHDGQNLFDGPRAAFGKAWEADEHAQRLSLTGQIATPIIVGIGNTPLRLREYMPSLLTQALDDDMRPEVEAIYGGPSLSDAYLDFIVQELKPFIDRTYRTRPGREHTVIMGSSMGGLISLHALIRHPDVFGGAGCLSTHWPTQVDSIKDDPVALGSWRTKLYLAWAPAIRDALPRPGRHRIYFDRGDETTEAFYAEMQGHVDDAIRARGYGARDFRTLYFPGAQHNEASWNARLDVPLTFLLPPVS